MAGEGLPVLFLHGWALGNRSYKRPLERLARLGCRVYAPALPGLGGSADLPADPCGLDGYAAWADAFVAAVGEKGPVHVVGHSLGGAVAVKLAHDFPDRVRALVLMNSLGGDVWRTGGGKIFRMADRPLLDWVSQFSKDLLLDWRAPWTLAAILEDAAPNIVTNPLGIWRLANAARRVDLARELSALRSSRVPVVAVSGSGDCIVPRASFQSLCEALGLRGRVVKGRHSWMLSDPGTFAAVMADVLSTAPESYGDVEARAAG